MIRFVFSLRSTVTWLVILIIPVTRKSEVGQVTCFFICCSDKNKLCILRNLMVLSSLSHMAGLGLPHSPYFLLFTFSGVFCKGNKDISSSSKQEVSRNVLGMNLSFGIFSYSLPKFENNYYERNANVNV